ncbi:MAG: response regulator [Deltaproteobacteria bacterium]|nr:response regulator [Deltaproteobacteria bacterium]
MQFRTDVVTLKDIDCEKMPMELVPGNYISLEVSDTGIGMTREVAARIFEPFFTTKGQGTGLGLSAVYGVLAAHKGGICVDSTPQKGTTFRIYLPLMEGANTQRRSSYMPPINQANLQILLVDDEEVVLEATSQMLQSLGYRVITAEDGRQAVDVYRARHHEIDLVIMDMMMPHKNGREAFEEMREINGAIRVLISTGYSVMDETRTIAQNSVVEFIHKPFRRHELAKKIDMALARTDSG